MTDAMQMIQELRASLPHTAEGDRGAVVLGNAWLYLDSRGKPVEPWIVNLALGRAGFATFVTQQEAERYLSILPDGYEGRSYKTESDMWAVSYRRVA